MPKGNSPIRIGMRNFGGIYSYVGIPLRHYRLGPHWISSLPLDKYGFGAKSIVMMLDDGEDPWFSPTKNNIVSSCTLNTV